MVVRGALSRDDFTYWSNIVQFEMKLNVQRLGQVAWATRSDPELRSDFWVFALHGALGEMTLRRDIPRSCAFPTRV